MEEQLIQKVLGIIYVVTLFAVFWILWKKGILRFRIGAYLGYSQFHNRRSCRAKYSLFNGEKSFYFRFQRETTVTLKYSVKVEKGAITMNLRNKAGELLTKTFSEDEEGEFEFITKGKWHSLHFDGQKTKGSYFIKFFNEISVT